MVDGRQKGGTRVPPLVLRSVPPATEAAARSSLRTGLKECYVPGQTAGRSAGLPVHWPLWPAPFPPLVGGLGLAHAADAVPTASALTTAPAARSFFICSPLVCSRLDRPSQPHCNDEESRKQGVPGAMGTLRVSRLTGPRSEQPLLRRGRASGRTVSEPPTAEGAHHGPPPRPPRPPNTSS